jgi:hypothetical protein
MSEQEMTDVAPEVAPEIAPVEPPADPSPAEEAVEKPEEGGEKEEEDDDEDGGLEVESIFAKGLGEDGEVLYQVRWVGYGPEGQPRSLPCTVP